MGTKNILGVAVAAAALAHTVATEHEPPCEMLAAPGDSACRKPDPVLLHIEQSAELQTAEARTYPALAGITVTRTYQPTIGVAVTPA
jgi:TPP-dependent trihydroxycyclohexane-1,2-dione (THcHDO) dehydratase